MAEKNIVWTNVAAFLNGTHYVGRISESTCECRRKTSTASSLGGLGDVAIPTGKYDAATGRLTFSNLAPADIRQLNINNGFITVRLTGRCRVTDSTLGTKTVDEAVTRISGWVLNPPVPGMSNDAPYTAELSVLFIEVTSSQGRIFMLDFDNGIQWPDEDTGGVGITVTL